MKKLLGKLKNKNALRALLFILVITFSWGGYLYYEQHRDRVFIDDSVVSAPTIAMTPATAGQLLETDVYEGEMIKKGDPVAIVGSQTIYSNTDGMVIMANNQTGSMTSMQTPVAQIIDTSNMRIAGTIDENKGLNQIHVGQVISFTVDALPGKNFWGYVDEVSPSARDADIST